MMIHHELFIKQASRLTSTAFFVSSNSFCMRNCQTSHIRSNSFLVARFAIAVVTFESHTFSAVANDIMPLGFVTGSYVVDNANLQGIENWPAF